jgi:hypothetical protein
VNRDFQPTTKGARLGRAWRRSAEAPPYAVSQGCKGVRQMKQDTAVDPPRRRQHFQMLVVELKGEAEIGNGHVLGENQFRNSFASQFAQDSIVLPLGDQLRQYKHSGGPLAARVGHLDMCVQAEVPSARKADSPR